MSTSGAYQVAFGGIGYDDAFIVKFDPSGARSWATYYGGSNYDGGRSITLDANANVLMCGYSASTSAISRPGAYQSTNAGGYDAFLAALTNSGSLPVHLLDFRAKLITNNSALLSWSTAMELNNDHFEVERTISNIPKYETSDSSNLASQLRKTSLKWGVVGMTKGGVNSNFLRNYEIIDNTVPTIINDYQPNSLASDLTEIYYRLKQVDFDGSYLYSDVICLNLKKQNIRQLNIYPNPSNDVFKILVDFPTNTIRIELVDLSGRTIMSIANSPVENPIVLDAKDLEAGIYSVKLVREDGFQSAVVIKSR
jgi:hypothetical protein